MKVAVNGKEKDLKPGAVLKDALAGEEYVKDSLVSVHLSTEKLRTVTGDFEIETTAGKMVISLADTPDAEVWRSLIESEIGSTTRWVTKDIVAFGAFPTKIAPSREEGSYRMYDVFFSLGGNDNHTTYIMIARRPHRRAYGAGTGLIGRISVGRHLVSSLREGEAITAIRPVESETSSENVIVTKDMSYKLGEGYSVDSHILVSLDGESPVSAEQMLIVGSKGYFGVSDSTGSFMGCRDDTDASIPEESHKVRDAGGVTVRCAGVGAGRIYIYKDKRQVSPSHNSAGKLQRGYSLAALAPAGEKITVLTEPKRALAVGMTQADGQRFLEAFGIKQKRTGDVSDDAVIADQNPEMTMPALSLKEAETFGVPKEKVFRVILDVPDPISNHYFKKVTGLSHKPVGTLKTQFAFPGMSLTTFYGDEERSKNLYPQEPFKKCRKGDIGITNQSRPHHGLIGIRLQDSREFGPTGEEPYGTNMVGRFAGDPKKLDQLEEDEIIYITEEEA
ncbi:MAG: methanogenesis marker 3 protein [Candidatus Methanoplasma sp.]|jgi:putative methanogenesis marker protein 3|nr:methanogenesis marker 3 protein [Candidatus Methanoplasma sp.]